MNYVRSLADALICYQLALWVMWWTGFQGAPAFLGAVPLGCVFWFAVWLFDALVRKD